MPLLKGKLIRHSKVKDDEGNIIEVKLWEVNPSIDKPHGYKYSLAYVVSGRRVIGYDNGEEKGDHKHYGEKVESHRFTTVWQLIDDFFQDVERCKKGDKL